MRYVKAAGARKVRRWGGRIVGVWERREASGETGQSHDLGALSSLLQSPQDIGTAGKTDPNQFVVYLAFLFPCFAR